METDDQDARGPEERTLLKRDVLGMLGCQNSLGEHIIFEISF